MKCKKPWDIFYIYSGDDLNKPCVFHFIFEDVTHYTCTDKDLHLNIQPSYWNCSYLLVWDMSNWKLTQFLAICLIFSSSTINSWNNAHFFLWKTLDLLIASFHISSGYDYSGYYNYEDYDDEGDVDKPCVFPFIYDDVTISICTTIDGDAEVCI